MTRLSTPDFIARAQAEVIEDSGREIDEHLIDGDGRVLIDPATEGARLLRELYAKGGHGTTTGNIDRRELAKLVEARLMKYKLPSVDRVDYDITDLGRLMVEEVLR